MSKSRSYMSRCEKVLWHKMLGIHSKQISTVSLLSSWKEILFGYTPPKDRFPTGSYIASWNLAPSGPSKLLRRLATTPTKFTIQQNEVSNSFNITDLSQFHGENANPMMSFFQPKEHDAENKAEVIAPDGEGVSAYVGYARDRAAKRDRARSHCVDWSCACEEHPIMKTCAGTILENDEDLQLLENLNS